jgi:mediator of RNA polymerase II transcription subunit 12
LQDGQLTSVTDKLRRVGELLRALVYIAQPFRKEGPLLLNLDPTTQDDFVTIVHDKLSTIKATLVERSASATQVASGEEDLSTTISQQVVLLVRLLQFDLGFRGAWTPKLKDLSSSFINNLFHLSLVRLYFLMRFTMTRKVSFEEYYSRSITELLTISIQSYTHS